MGGCLGPEPNYSVPNHRNPPVSATSNNQSNAFDYKYQSTPSPQGYPKPILTPNFPKNLVLPSSNPYLINQIYMVPH